MSSTTSTAEGTYSIQYVFSRRWRSWETGHSITRSKHQDSSYDGREAFWQKQSLLRRIKSPEDCKGSRGRSRVLTWNPVNEIQIALVLRERREQRDKTALMGKPYNTGLGPIRASNQSPDPLAWNPCSFENTQSGLGESKNSLERNCSP